MKKIESTYAKRNIFRSGICRKLSVHVWMIVREMKSTRIMMRDKGKGR